jgi:hypothetical protein
VKLVKRGNKTAADAARQKQMRSLAN